MSADITRREFLGTASAGMIAAATMGRLANGAMAGVGAGANLPGFGRVRVLRVFMGPPRSGWPSPLIEAEADVQRLKAEMAAAPGLDDVEFVGDELLVNPGAVLRLLEQHRDVAGVLAVQVAGGTTHTVCALADSGFPTMMLAVPYSGHEWCIVPDLQKAGKKIDVLPSSDAKAVADAIRPLRAISRLRETRLLLVSGGWQPPESFIPEVREKLGVEIMAIGPERLSEAFDAVDAEAAEADAKQWIGQAEVVKEPTREEIVKSARFSLALQNVLVAEKAHAITINCLGLFGQGKLPAYPCLGFARLNDLGYAGVCEADLASALTQIMYTHLAGVPGFVTDPVFDLSNGTLIHAHCVSATKMDGPAGPACPYAIRSHLEDNKGASLQVKMRLGQEITMAKLVGADARAAGKNPYLAATPAESLGASTLLVSTGTIVEVPDVDRGCRTKVAVKVRDAQKMLDGWTHGLHRVIFYGNHMTDTRRLGRLLGLSVVEEG